jgi:hypothetical protein
MRRRMGRRWKMRSMDMYSSVMIFGLENKGENSTMLFIL